MKPILIASDNLSAAWSRAFLHIIDHPGQEVSPLVVSITGFSEDRKPTEDSSVKDALNVVLKNLNAVDVDDAAYTIFPQRLWEMARGNRKTLFQFYKMAFPGYQSMNRSLNGRGLYFERLVQYGRGPEEGNQLEWILSQFGKRPGVRRSMLQASVFDPGRDHTAQVQVVFPCLQHVAFGPSKDGLVVNAFYATQQVLHRAYGNFVGLAQLGAFMAHEMDMPLAQLNVMAGVEKLEKIGKSDSRLVELIAASRACVAAEEARKNVVSSSTPMQLGAFAA